ncbi:hypothetical protein LTR08_005407 [Meristemomyces frigidus]|nr:hypothetical protein LTR08_005407 [Meristemomyces frigidus]
MGQCGGRLTFCLSHAYHPQTNSAIPSLSDQQRTTVLTPDESFFRANPAWRPRATSPSSVTPGLGFNSQARQGVTTTFSGANNQSLHRACDGGLHTTDIISSFPLDDHVAQAPQDHHQMLLDLGLEIQPGNVAVRLLNEEGTGNAVWTLLSAFLKAQPAPVAHPAFVALYHQYVAHTDAPPQITQPSRVLETKIGYTESNLARAAKAKQDAEEKKLRDDDEKLEMLGGQAGVYYSQGEGDDGLSGTIV